MAKNIYRAIGRIGWLTGYLDSIDGTDLADQDVARGESLQCTRGIKLSEAV